MRYRKKPVVIEAIQWTGENQREMFDFLTNGEKKDEYMEAFGEHFRIDHAAVKGGLVIKTLEGNHWLTLEITSLKVLPENFTLANRIFLKRLMRWQSNGKTD